MLSILLGFFTGLAGPISSIVSKITDLQLAKVQANSNSEKIKIDQQIEEAHDRKAVLVAEAGSRFASALNSSMRAYIAIGPATFVFKIFFWDKVVGSLIGCSGQVAASLSRCSSFRTDPIDTTLWGVVTDIIAFYFLYDLSTKRK